MLVINIKDILRPAKEMIIAAKLCGRCSKILEKE
tara:strand:- start:405 stop:506 length:102 start_codon:yes stop_codon:yes gene_type:complete